MPSWHRARGRFRIYPNTWKSPLEGDMQHEGGRNERTTSRNVFATGADARWRCQLTIDVEPGGVGYTPVSVRRPALVAPAVLHPGAAEGQRREDVVAAGADASGATLTTFGYYSTVDNE